MTHRLVAAQDGSQTVEVWYVTQAETEDQAEQGMWVGTPVSISGGRLLFWCRVGDKANTHAQNFALYQAAARDPQFNLEVSNDDGATWHDLPGTTISHIGSVVVTDEVRNDQDVVTTSAVIDTRHHFNVLFNPVRTRVGAWESLALAQVLLGSNITDVNHNESGKKLVFSTVAIELLEPGSFSPSRVF